MAIDLKNLSPKELQAVIADAQSKMKFAQSNLVQDVRKRIDALLSISGLTLADVYPTRGGKKTSRKSAPAAPKYRDPADPAKTWTGRGRQPLWFAKALKKRGATADSLLISGATPKAPAETEVKAIKKAGAKKTSKA